MRRNSPDEMIAKGRAIHGDRYGYERMVYRNTQTKVLVTCHEHGDFSVLPINHFYKARGCPACGALTRGRRKNPMAAGRATADAKLARFSAKFVEDAHAVHGKAYDYSATKYLGRRQKMTIVCPKHGEFIQTAMNHIDRGQGCPECSHHRSKGEAMIFRFVSIFARVIGRDRSVIAPKELDIWLPDHKLAIEYCGEYWHGSDCEKDEPFARRRHIEKHEDCEAGAIRLLTIYESEWLARPHALKHLIRNAMGKGRGRVGARECTIRNVGNAEAMAFFERYHVQGGEGFGVHYGLYLRDRLVGCMRFTLGANDRGAGSNRVWTLTRYATRISVPGGASRLFKAFVDEHDPEEVKSFSDNRYFDGAMYERLGFRLDERLAPDYQVYHPKLGLRPKAAWQRREIPKRIRDLKSSELYDPDCDPRSERQMTYLLGAHRIFDCGKKRWLWTKASDLV